MQTAPEWLQAVALLTVAPQFALTALIVGARLYSDSTSLPAEMLALHRRVSRATPPVVAVVAVVLVAMDSRRVADIILLVAAILFFVAPMTHARIVRRPLTKRTSEPEWTLHVGPMPEVKTGHTIEWGVQHTWSDGYTEVVPAALRTGAEASAKLTREGRTSAVVLRVVPGRRAAAVLQPETQPQTAGPR